LRLILRQGKNLRNYNPKRLMKLLLPLVIKIKLLGSPNGIVRRA
jgi:hypothetical protein